MLFSLTSYYSKLSLSKNMANRFMADYSPPRIKSAIAVGLAAAFMANLSFASPTQPIAGKDYVLLATPQKSSAQGGKVEVLQFILFHCKHCAALDPLTKQWAQLNGQLANVKTLHATFRGPKDPEVRLFHTLQAINELNTWTPKVFLATQQQGVRMTADNEVLEWAKQSGLDGINFQRAWNSTSVVETTARTPELVKAYDLTYAPAFIVDGKFMTSPALIKKNNPEIPMPLINQSLFKVLDFLVQNSKDAK